MHIRPLDGQQPAGNHSFRWAAECLEIQQIIYKKQGEQYLALKISKLHHRAIE